VRRNSRPRTKLSLEAANKIRRESQENPTATPDHLGRKYGVSITTITAVLKGKIWKQA